MKPQTQQHVWDILYNYSVSQLPKLTRWTLADIKQAYPFHRLLFSDEAVLAARVERSVVTTMGDRLYPSLAKAISQDKYIDVHTEHVIEGAANDAACNMIEQIVTELRTPKSRRPSPREPNHQAELSDILNSPGGGQTSRAVTADLYIGDFEGGPLFIELKTPLPNLDVAAESKRKMLYFLLLMDRMGVTGARAFLGLTYNPFLTRKNYRHSFTKQIMDMNNQVLMGQEMWDMIGGPDTFKTLLEIIEDVHQSLPNT